jgi:hypothetical protein
MQFSHQRAGKDFPEIGHPSVWLRDCRLLFVGNYRDSKIRDAKFFGSWSEGELLYLGISDITDSLESDERLKKLKPGVYIEIPEKPRFAFKGIPKTGETSSATILSSKIQSLKSFLRSIQAKNVRDGDPQMWRFRANVLRKIEENKDAFSFGLNRIIAISGEKTTPNARPLRSSATPDLASEGVSDEQSRRFNELLAPHLAQISRTKPIDRSRINDIVADFYAQMGLLAPTVVVLPNPLSTAIAGGFSTALLFAEKNTIVPSLVKISSPVSNGLLSRRLAEEIVERAMDIAHDYLDEDTRRDLLSILRPISLANRFRNDALRFLEYLETEETLVRHENSSVRRSSGVAQLAELNRFADREIYPNWDLDFKPICDAINQVIFDRIDLGAHEKHQSVKPGLEELAYTISGGNLYLNDLLLWALHSKSKLLLDITIKGLALYVADVLNVETELFNQFSGWAKFAREGAAFVVHEEFCFISDFPELMVTDDNGRLHNSEGPAIRWPDGWSCYYWRNTPIPPWMIEEKERITVEAINSMENIEIRRVMLEIYGTGKYIIDSGTKEVQRDEYGVLYWQEMPDDEPLRMVRVTNSTAEPDGAFRDYWLRVPPGIRTAREAVAWTFNLDEDEYAPTIET